MLFKELYEKSGWIAPSKIAKRSLKPQRKEPRSLTLNEFLIETLKKEIPKNKRSAFIDKILSEHFGIKYEEAYPEAYANSYGEERYWDTEGVYRKMDILDPARFSTKSKRKTRFYKDFMKKIKE